MTQKSKTSFDLLEEIVAELNKFTPKLQFCYDSGDGYANVILECDRFSTPTIVIGYIYLSDDYSSIEISNGKSIPLSDPDLLIKIMKEYCTARL